MKSRQIHWKSEQGMTTVIVLLLLMTLTVLGLGGVVVSTMEGRIAANQYVAKQANFAAEAGADRAVLWLMCYLNSTEQLAVLDTAYPTGSFPPPDTTELYLQTSYDPEGPLSSVRVFRYYTASPSTTRLHLNGLPARFPDNVTAASGTPPACGSVAASASALTQSFVNAVRGTLTLSSTNTVLGKTLDLEQKVGYTASVELVQRDPITWRIVSIGSKTDGSAPVATQAVAYIVKKDSPKVDPPAALTVGGKLKVAGNAEVSSELDGKYGATSADTITINGNNATIKQAGPDGTLGTPDDVVANSMNCNMQSDAIDPNVGYGNLPHFWEIFFKDEYSKSQYSSYTNEQKDVMALDQYRNMAKEISQNTISRLGLSSPDQVPTDGTNGTKGYKGLYFINLGSGGSASYTGQPGGSGQEPTGNALVSGNTTNNDPNSPATLEDDDAAVLVIVGSASSNSRDILDPAQSYTDVTVNGSNFTGFLYVVGDFRMQGNSTLNGAVISTGDQNVNDTDAFVGGTGQGLSKISYTKKAAVKLADAIPYTKKKKSFAEVGLLK